MSDDDDDSAHVYPKSITCLSYLRPCSPNSSGQSQPSQEVAVLFSSLIKPSAPPLQNTQMVSKGHETTVIMASSAEHELWISVTAFLVGSGLNMSVDDDDT